MAAGRHNLTRRAVLGGGGAATVIVVSGAGAAATGSPAETLSTVAPLPPAPRARSAPSPRIDIICGECGGGNVMRDAWAVWDLEEQDWVLGAVFDAGHCDDCEREARLEETELTPQPSRTG